MLNKRKYEKGGKQSGIVK